jgi:hypothetical protein
VRHDFGVQAGYAVRRQRSRIVAEHALQHLRFALRPQHRAFAFEVADLLRPLGTPVQQPEQLVVDAVDLGTVLFQTIAHAVPCRGKSRTISTPGIAAMRAVAAGGMALSVSTRV